MILSFILFFTLFITFAFAAFDDCVNDEDCVPDPRDCSAELCVPKSDAEDPEFLKSQTTITYQFCQTNETKVDASKAETLCQWDETKEEKKISFAKDQSTTFTGGPFNFDELVKVLWTDENICIKFNKVNRFCCTGQAEICESPDTAESVCSPGDLEFKDGEVTYVVLGQTCKMVAPDDNPITTVLLAKRSMGAVDNNGKCPAAVCKCERCCPPAVSCRTFCLGAKEKSYCDTASTLQTSLAILLSISIAILF
mmetsp:Transcript_20976/g.35673  ORF Transcript_20976/g.35673 Transcript_20976/m.35673 type:complete len:253 (-) Transcript_20976:60-818(-)